MQSLPLDEKRVFFTPNVAAKSSAGFWSGQRARRSSANILRPFLIRSVLVRTTIPSSAGVSHEDI
jgi:hypothetical protein